MVNFSQTTVYTVIILLTCICKTDGTLCYHSDFQIKIVSLEDYAMIGCFTDHVAPVLTVEFDPVGEFLVSSFTAYST